MISTAGDIADFYERLFIGDFLGPEMLSAMLILCGKNRGKCPMGDHLPLVDLPRQYLGAGVDNNDVATRSPRWGVESY